MAREIVFTTLGVFQKRTFDIFPVCSEVQKLQTVQLLGVALGHCTRCWLTRDCGILRFCDVRNSNCFFDLQGCNCELSEIVVFVVVVLFVRKIKKCCNVESETLSRTLFFCFYTLSAHARLLHHCWFVFLRVCCDMCCDILRFCDVRDYCLFVKH